MKFPKNYYDKIIDYSNDYFSQLQYAIENVNYSHLENVVDLLEKTYKNKKKVFVCGNGGSAAVANHMVCDHGKLISSNTNLKPQVYSLNNSNEMLTAISNDISYEEVFSFQLQNLAEENDLLLIISGSGDSVNVVKALEMAKSLKMKTISFTGFNGGKCKEISEINVHIPVKNYGVIEDIHQSLMQIVAQFIRQKNMKPHEIEKTIF